MPEPQPAAERIAALGASRPEWRGIGLGGAALAILVVGDIVTGSDVGTADWAVRLFLVGVGTVLAVAAARARVGAAETLARQRLLGAIGEVADGTKPLLESVEQLNDLLVPAIADCVVIDTVQGGQMRRLSVRATGPDAREWERMVFDDPSAPPDVPGSPASALRSGKPRWVAAIDDDLLDRMIRSDDYREFLRTHPVQSIISVPLRSRGLDLGVMVLITGPSGRRYDEGDVDFASVLAGRASLVLDNAGLSQELMTTEQQLRAVLANLAEAVTVQDRDGALVFANQAAADLLGAASVNDLLRTPPLDLIGRFDTFNPDGSRLRLEQLPGRKVLAGEHAEPLLVRAVNKATGEERWRLTKASPIVGADGRPAFAVNIVEDVSDSKRAELTQRILAEAGRLLGSSLDYERTVQRIADLCVPDLADWCSVSVPGGDGYVEQVAVAHMDPGKVEWARTLAERWRTSLDEPTGAPNVIRTGQAEMHAEIPDELLVQFAKDDEHLEILRRLGMKSVVIVPVTVGLRTMGALSMVSAESGRKFSEADLELAEELGRRAGTAIENARMFSERSRIAMMLQAGLLPPRLPDMEGWVARSLYRPAGEETQVGGDFYDLFPTAAGWMALIGDVAGRGPAAASLTSMARYTLRTAGTLVGAPAMGLARLNESLRERGGTALCTAAVVLLHEENGAAAASVVCAGHPRPFLIRGGTVETVGATGPLLGAFEDGHWPPVRVDVGVGDVLVLYTDGVIDARGETDRFGEERLVEVLTGTSSADEVVERIRSALDEFEVEDGKDDTAVLAIMRTA